MTVSSELRDHVIERDAVAIWYWSEDKVHHGVRYAKWRASHRVVCIVPLIDPFNPHTCGGKQEVDHVKDQLRMGKRAPDDEFHLVAMCQNHNTWSPPRKELRHAEREYLKSHAQGVRTNPASTGAPLQAPRSGPQQEGKDGR